MSSVWRFKSVPYGSGQHDEIASNYSKIRAITICSVPHINLTLNQRVTGSSPVAPTNKINDLHDISKSPRHFLGTGVGMFRYA